MTSDASPPEGGEGGGVLSNLPRHRPGRPTARRASGAGARSPASRPAAAKPARAGAQRGAAKSSRRPKASGRPSAGGAAAPRASASPMRPIAIPEQGFEVEEEVRVGKPVEPPSRLELATSIFELAGEGFEAIVKGGVSAGGSLIKRTLDLVPKP